MRNLTSLPQMAQKRSEFGGYHRGGTSEFFAS
jgi:hypothetical protein